MSDNGPLFVAAEFQKLTKEWDIEHMVTSTTKVKRMDRLRQQSSLLRNCSARLLKTATIFTWDFLRYAILNHRVLPVAPLNGSWTEEQRLCCPALALSWSQVLSRRSSKKLYAYGAVTPLEVIGTFTRDLSLGSKIVSAEVSVIKGQGEPLRGRESAVELETKYDALT